MKTPLRFLFTISFLLPRTEEKKGTPGRKILISEMSSTNDKRSCANISLQLEAPLNHSKQDLYLLT
jgi:hypothetical protein